MKMAMLACAVCALVVSALTSGPWCDELTFADSAFNFLQTGEWESNVWYCVYSPLFPLVTAGMMKVFGTSHFVASASCILFALISSCVLVDVLRRRRWIETPLSAWTLVVLFWCGYSSSWIWGDGRPDAATMLFSIVLIDTLAPDGSGERKTLLAFLAALFLVLTSSYMLPVLFVFGCLVLCFAHGDERKGVVCRGFAAAGGIAFGYALIVVFYWWQHELVRFVGFMVYFNSVTGLKSQPLIGRLLRAYQMCPDVFVLLLVVACTRRFIRECVCVALIPAVMVVCGRYEAYYAWTVHLASAVLLARAVPFLPCSVVFAILMMTVGAYFAKVGVALQTFGDRRSETRMAREFVRTHRDLLLSCSVVVAADTVGDVSLYYPLLEIGADIWYRGPETLAAPSDREKFTVGLSAFVADSAQREKLLKKAFSIQKCQDVLPQNGLLVCHRLDDKDKVMSFLPKLNRKVEKLTGSGAYEIYKLYESE